MQCATQNIYFFKTFLELIETLCDDLQMYIFTLNFIDVQMSGSCLTRERNVMGWTSMSLACEFMTIYPFNRQ